MDEVFRALADPSRRELLDRLDARNGQSLRELTEGLGMTRQSVSKHLAVLEAAGLVRTARRGREKAHFLDTGPIGAITDRWIRRYDRTRVDALGALKRALEQRAQGREQEDMSDEFVYTTYIDTTPEALWRALTDPEFTRRYWGVAFETDWAVGSPITWEENGVRVSDPEQVVLAAEPGRLLSYTWHTFTPEWAEGAGIDADVLARLVRERRSRVRFEIEQAGPVVRLTVVHDGFDPGSTVLSMIGQGWPQLLSALKTLLETGRPLPS